MAGTKKRPAAKPPSPPVSRRFRAKLFRNGGSQAVRLPRECRLPGDEVSVILEGSRIVLEPVDAKGFTRDFVDLFLSGTAPAPDFPDRDQQPVQDRDLTF